MTAHSRYGGSSAERWMNCAGSVALCATIPEPPETKFAQEGTLAHALAAHCLRTGARSARPYSGYEGEHEFWNEKVTIDVRMAAAVDEYLDAVWEEFDASPDAELYVEQKFVLDVKGAAGDCFGTLDALVYTPSKARLWIGDYKHGIGMAVAAEGNHQERFYAGAAITTNKWPLKEVVVAVIQPRDWRNDYFEDSSSMRTWAVSPVDLFDFIGEVEQAIERAKATRKLTAGSWCQWCPARGRCPAQAERAFKDLPFNVGDVVDLETNVLPSPSVLTPEQIGQYLKACELIVEWRGHLAAAVDTALRSGQEVPGYKLVEKQARAHWVASDEDVAAWMDMVHGVDPREVTPPALVTITEAKQLLKMAYPDDKKKAAKAVEDLTLRFTLRESSGLTVASASDKRDAAHPTASEFAGVDLGA